MGEARMGWTERADEYTVVSHERSVWGAMESVFFGQVFVVWRYMR